MIIKEDLMSLNSWWNCPTHCTWGWLY